MEKVSIDLFIPEIKGKRLEMSTVNVVPVFSLFLFWEQREWRVMDISIVSLRYIYVAMTVLGGIPWVASNIVCAREWVIFSIILCFTLHFQQFEKIEMTKDVYMYYIKLTRLTWKKIWVTDLINLWDDCTFFNCSRLTTFFSLLPKKDKALNKGQKIFWSW